MAPSGLIKDQKDNAPRPGPRPRPARLRAAALAACGAATAGLLLAGCGDDVGNGGGGASTPPPASAPASSPPASSPATGTERPLTGDQAERKALVPAAKTGWEQAARAATDDVAGSKLVAVELKRSSSGGGPEWHAEVATADGTAHSVVVDGVTGKVTRSTADADQDGDDKQKLADRLKAARVTPQEAAATATGRKKGTVTTLELDTGDEKAGEGKKLIWSVDVVTTDDWNKTTYDIDANNRAVLREHMDRD
ncbi:PepSY domain-containing protein [Streptomyces sp. I05A-00742]|uniref:PepSY domain-containing protein n=1 Tax=Streptomyces sp. I05A-00742 TaxID=2732853 RepID=UPI001487F515|nr:PepSY domain-containing protein [Streptomyces sp. I05A-00742]